jgi:adenine-specific DNA-methyltransferase
MLAFGSRDDLVALALALGAHGVASSSETADEPFCVLPSPSSSIVLAAKQAILQGHDPLGDMYCCLLNPEKRRPLGATYTPQPIVSAMLAWAADQIDPVRIVDPGVGSARFLVAAGRRFPTAQLVGVEIDPLAALLARGHLAAAGLQARANVIVGDYREVALPPVAGPTLYLGNPPYVRHHLIGEKWKTWLTKTARARGFTASQLAGLHVHFFLRIAATAKKGDVGALITAAEWLDVNYGRLVRQLLLGPLGVSTVHVIEPAAKPFPDAATTAVITGFEVGARPGSIGLRRVEHLAELGALTTDWQVRRERLEQADRWTPLTRAARETPAGFIELGELCRVHRGQVTGANRVWIAGMHSLDLPRSVLFQAVTKARELFALRDFLTDPSALRSVIDLPVDLDTLDVADRQLCMSR